MKDEIMVIRMTPQVGGDCCGGLADDEFICMSDTFVDVRAEMEQIGVVYRRIHQQYGDEIDVTYLDPRNNFAILGYLLRRWKGRFIHFPEFCKSLFFGIRRGAFFYNGHWMNPDQTIDGGKILAQIKGIREKGKS